MKKIFYISAMALAAGAALTSCSDFLEADNKSAGGQTADQYFNTPEGLAAWRTNTYYSIRPLATNQDINDQGTDLYWPSRGRGEGEFSRYTLNPESSSVKNYYAACFELVNNANGLLFFGGDQHKGEALFLRCLGYYYLTQHFGAVPYSTNYINDANRDYARTDIKEIYDACLADLQEAYSLLPEKTTNDGTANKRAAAALAAKMALAAAWDLETSLTDANSGAYNVSGTSYAKQAQSWASQALQGIELTQSFEQKWAPSNEDKNPETFFSVQYDRASFPGTGGGHGLQNDYGSYYGDISTTFMKSVGSDKVPSLKSLYLWEKGDERYQGTFMTTFYNSPKSTWGTEGYYAYYNASESEKATLPIAYLYVPYYVTEAELKSMVADMKDRFPSGLNVEPHAYIMANPVKAYTFKNGALQADNSSSTGGAAYNYATLQTRMNYTPTVKKWDDPATPQSNGNTSECYRDVIMLHASDIYLVAAEACMLQGDDAGCLDNVNKVRARAKASKINSLASYDPAYSYTGSMRMVDLVLDERARECYAELSRWMDLRRTRQLVKYTVAYNCLVDNVDAMSTQGKVKWYRPIPEAELNSNISDGMYQNEGY